MTHVVSRKTGNNVLTKCGSYISVGALGTALNKNRAIPYIDLYSMHEYPRGTVFGALCKKCMCQAGVVNLILSNVPRIMYMKEVHIFGSTTPGSATGESIMLCGTLWNINELFQNNVGYVKMPELKMSERNMCKKCTDHPRAQLQILANVEL